MAITIPAKASGVYGQVEDNHLNFKRTGAMYAQLPAVSTIEVLENGQFAKYDMAAGKVNMTGDGDFLLVYNEVKIYKDFEMTKNFALKKTDAYGEITPRLCQTYVGDIFTTDAFGAAEVTLAVGDKLTVGDDGFLAKNEAPAAGEMVWKVVKETTMPDASPAVKLQRIQ